MTGGSKTLKAKVLPSDEETETEEWPCIQDRLTYIVRHTFIPASTYTLQCPQARFLSASQSQLLDP